MVAKFQRNLTGRFTQLFPSPDCRDILFIFGPAALPPGRKQKDKAESGKKLLIIFYFEVICFEHFSTLLAYSFKGNKNTLNYIMLSHLLKDT
ncbi:hypothetical protein EG349_11185 [Chryseobacterium shandongense]|uniref:Uncharacterized protein n=1 Tax=Chryseobacterium shandongense TaxID=1493872 RepID=A0AAD1DLC1_9FLAO|nr:hypothetical protein EG349_11185 [Chryseobacterium shandongense]AZA95817.1 hypothetical protein EG353_09640 [Chryseobacterium shandongense]